MTKRKKIVLMAIAAGRETTEGNVSKVHIGVAGCSLLAINPTKEELSKLLGTEENPVTIEKEPEYLFTDDKGVVSARIEFVLKTLPEYSNGIEAIKRLSYFVKNEKKTNKDKTKFQMINSYGDTVWLTEADIKSKSIPANIKGFATKGLRYAYTGEEELVNFIKKFMNIPRYASFKADGEIVINAQPEICECQLESIKSYFEGNFNELQIIKRTRQTNKIKLLFGAKISNDNKVYQDCFASYPMSFAMFNYTHLTKNLENRIANGGYPNTTFGTEPYLFQEFKISVTPVASVKAETTIPDTPNWGVDEEADDLPFN